MKFKIVYTLLLLLLKFSFPALAAEQIYFYHTDPAGTPLAMTNSTGAVVWKADYKPFGEENSVTGAAINGKRFVGKEKDEETGLSYFGARYEDAKTGRFTAVDPVRAVDTRSSKTNEMLLLNPQRLNVYTYALNNPYTFIDPDGRLTVYIWNYRGKDAAWGHASITLENGTHISWWPSADGREPNKLISQIYTSPANNPQEFRDDVKSEGQRPDHQIRIIGLNEGKIESWWQKFKQTNQWNTTNQNCSTTAADALKTGGGSEHASWMSSHNLIWKPSDVKNFAESIKANIER